MVTRAAFLFSFTAASGGVVARAATTEAYWRGDAPKAVQLQRR